jgi:pteridine reductase
MNPRKVALVTGSGKRRVGRYVVEALARRGYALALHYHHSADEAAEAVAAFEKQGVEAGAFRADLASDGEVRRMFEAILQKWGRIDVVVNSAAIWKKKLLEEITAADVREHLEINTIGTFLCCQHAGLVMVNQVEGGLIVNIGDWAEVRPYLNYAAYFPSKGAVSTMTRCFAVELASRNPRIRVNCILPGPIMLSAELSEAERDESIRGTLVKREGHPDNVAQAVLSFLDNDFVTGVCLPVDGGRSIYTND